MLRIDLLDTTILRMSGRLAEGCREEVEGIVGAQEALPKMIVDLSQITYIDREGEELLCQLGRRGAKFAADSPYVQHVCERLHLAMPETRAASLDPLQTASFVRQRTRSSQ